MKSVLLCGCGNIGFRHLQAMTRMPEKVMLTIVEPNMAAHARIAAFMATDGNGHGFVVQDRLPDARMQFDLVVVATSADVRRSAVDSILAQHGVGVMILEKVLFQRMADLDQVQAVLNARGIAAFVNCPRRVFPGYQDLRQRLTGPVDVVVSGSAFGLASNGIHLLDLCEYLNRAPLLSVDASGLYAGSVPAKRADCVEVFGHLSARMANGSTTRITCDDQPQMALQVELTTADGRIVIDELARTITDMGKNAPFETRFVSETWEIYAQALTTGTTALTPYADSLRQHRLFLAALLEHLGLAADAACPIS